MEALQAHLAGHWPLRGEVRAGEGEVEETRDDCVCVAIIAVF
jgi:hypothetical protein